VRLLGAALFQVGDGGGAGGDALGAHVNVLEFALV
jgi:hypothetical protein